MDNHDFKNFSLLDNIIKENSVVIDVGANNGEYTEFFKRKLSGSGKIYSIELFPETCKNLKTKYSNDSNIIVLNYAVSNVDGMIPFYAGNHHCLHNILGHDVNFNTTKIAGEINSIRLDTLLKNEEKINLIKIDVEGAELLVLKGCEKIINKIDFILVECHLSIQWEEIKNLLLDKYDLECYNNTADVDGIQKIEKDSSMAYQCFCKKKNG